MNSFFNLLKWLSMRCLDVVIIALLWQEYLGQVLQVEIFGYERIVLALSVWLVYVGDRWLDVKRIETHRIESIRHKFMSIHMSTFRVLFWGILMVDMAIAFTWIPWDRICLGLAILILAIVYTLFSARSEKGALPKELLSAAIFSLGVFLFIFEVPAAYTLPFWGHFVFFVFLLFANAGLIAHWEQFLDIAQGQHSIAQRWERSYHFFRTLALLSGVGGALATFSLFHNHFLLISPYFIAGAGMWTLHLFRRRLGGERLHEFADLCLFSPVIPLFFLML